MAGIRAAAVLEQYGVKDFLILEAANRIGGRLVQAPMGNSGLFVEQGGNWVQGLKGNPIWKLARECGLKGTKQDWDSVVSYNEFGNKVPDSRMPWARYEAASQCVESTIQPRIENGSFPDISLRASLAMCGWDPITPVDWAVEWFYENYEWAFNVQSLATRWVYPRITHSDFEDADYFVTDQDGGYAKVITCHARRTGVLGPRIIFNTTVTRITPPAGPGASTSSPIAVTTRGGGTYAFDFVISTLPNGVLQRNFSTLFPKGLFSPAKKAALYELRMATFSKLLLQFPRVFWDPSQQFILQASDGDAGDMVLWQSLDPVKAGGGFLPGSKILFGVIEDQYSMAMEALPDEYIIRKAMQRLRRIFPDAPDPINWVFPKWYTNPLAYGSYSTYPAGLTEEEFERFRAPLGRLYFSGEATCKRMIGYVHSAYGAGERSAKQVLRAMGRPGIPDPDNSFCEKKLSEQGEPLKNKRRRAW